MNAMNHLPFSPIYKQQSKAKKCKQFAPELQMEYRHRLAKAKEEEDNIPAAVYIRNLTHQENARSLFRCCIRYLECNNCQFGYSQSYINH
jgi:hypothetical protein